MRKEVHVLKSGANITLRTYTIGELVNIKLVKTLITSKQLKSFSKTNSRHITRIAGRLANKLMVMFFDKLAERAINSDRVLLKSIFAYSQIDEFYITDVQQSSKRYINHHTNGKVYNAVIPNFPNINIKFSSKYRKVLKERLEDGQPFY